jgi:hypothetical protein
MECWSVAGSFEASKKVRSVARVTWGNDESRMTNDDLTRSCRPWSEEAMDRIDGAILSKNLGLWNAKIEERAAMIRGTAPIRLRLLRRARAGLVATTGLASVNKPIKSTRQLRKRAGGLAVCASHSLRLNSRLPAKDSRPLGFTVRRMSLTGAGRWRGILSP